MRLLRPILAVIFAALCPLVAAAQASHPLLQRPTFNGNLIVFSYAGDLWTVDRTGGHASRLTTGTGIETDPIFSPDGSMIAFTGEYDGNTDVFIVPTSGGVPKRLTYHPGADAAVGWTPENILPTRLWAARRPSIMPPMLHGETTAEGWQARYGLPTWRRST